MMENLPLKSLGDVCNFVRGPFGGSLKKDMFVKEGFAVYEQQHAIYNQFHEIRYFIDDKKFDEMKRFELKSGDLIMSCSGTMGKVAIVPDSINKGVINQALLKLTPKEGLIKEYLKYWMDSEDFKESIARHSKGAAIKNVASVQILKSILLPYPDIDVQKYIVSLLDKAFTAIDQAKSNVELNIKNTNELLESKLNTIFNQFDSSCHERNFGDKDIVQLIDGDRGSNYPKKAEFLSKGYCVFLNTGNVRPNGFDFSYIDFINENRDRLLRKGKLSRMDVVMTTRGTIGNIGLYNEDIKFEHVRINSGMLIFRPNRELLLPEYLFEVLRSPAVKKQIKEKTTGAAQPQLPINILVNLVFPLPSLKQQRETISQLNKLYTSIDKLIVNYKSKLELIETLKRSILNAAFTGLLEFKYVKPTSKALIMSISNTDLHAGIIALSFQRHEQANTLNTFHHVKSEKIAHMIETHLRIDLGRNPVKDAAGPNDYPLKMKVESRAKKAGFFYVEQSGEMKNYNKGSQFDKLIEKTSNALGDHLNDVCSLIDIMAPMSTQQAEIVATVYAAWNNLLIDKAEITDQAIVQEAREDWHPQKLKIERERFFKAITWMREHDLVPTGSGNRVNKKS